MHSRGVKASVSLYIILFALVMAGVGVGHFFGMSIPRPFLTAAIALQGLTGVVIAIRFLLLSGKKSNAERTVQAMIESFGKTLDMVFRYFDNSFLLVNVILGPLYKRNDSVENVREMIQKLYRENALEQVKARFDNSSNGTGAGKDTAQKAEEIIKHSENLVMMLSAADQQLPKDARRQAEIIGKNTEFNELIGRVILSYEFYSQLIREFFSAIIVDLTKSSRPLSEEILAIKEGAGNFVGQIGRWENELSDENSEKNFSRLLKNYDTQNAEFGRLFHAINESYGNLSHRLESLKGLIDGISSQNSRIQGIAENINILSINASIEAARASGVGKGFKVISDEIKKLSELTNTIIGDILGTMEGARGEIAAALREFGTERDVMQRAIQDQRSEFAHFYDILRSYETNFKGIFSSVGALTRGIDQHIDKFNPLFQLHEVCIQEMENLNKIINEFMGSQESEMKALVDGFPMANRDEYLKKLILQFEQKTISQFEINVLKKIIDLNGFSETVVLSNSSTEIQIF